MEPKNPIRGTKSERARKRSNGQPYLTGIRKRSNRDAKGS